MSARFSKFHPVSRDARTVCVGEAWAVVHSFQTAQFYIEELPEAVHKNYRSFAAAAAEDWQIIGLFRSHGEAHDALTGWIRTPGAERARDSAIL
jgi:hypothetical protein